MAPATGGAGAPAKAKTSKAAKARKPDATKTVRSHPPYIEMIKEAIVALKERSGSSQYAIAKFIEEKQSNLPPNFKKLLLVQLRRLVASGKLVKVRNSFKISAEAKPKTGVSVKAKSAAPLKAKPTPAVKKANIAAKSTAPAKKKKAVKTAVAKVKKTPVKKPKSIKSPVKKAAAKK